MSFKIVLFQAKVWSASQCCFKEWKPSIPTGGKMLFFFFFVRAK